MGKFRYNLQKVLDFRLRKEEDAKQALSQANHQCDIEKDALDQLSARHAAAQKQMSDQLQGGRTGDVQMSNDYVKSLEEKTEAQTAKLKKSEAARDEANKKYVEASKERSIMEKHREKEHLKWIDEEKRLEAINLDEMANNGFLKKRRFEQAEKEEAGEEDEEEADTPTETHSPWIEGLFKSAQQARKEGEHDRF